MLVAIMQELTLVYQLLIRFPHPSRIRGLVKWLALSMDVLVRGKRPPY